MPRRQRFRDAKRELLYAHERNTSLCAPFVSVLPVGGAAVSVLAGSSGQSTVCSTSATASRLDELQFDLGEGPCWDALATRRPVFADDFRAGGSEEWPLFGNAVRDDALGEDVGALYAFPLYVGSLDIGAIDLYSLTATTLDTEEIEFATELASITSWQVLRRVLGDSAVDDAEGPATVNRREVHQATGMILAQLDVTAAEASLLLRAHAFAMGRTVAEVANDVVGRRLNFATDRTS
jgi:hypothetical protein